MMEGLGYARADFQNVPLLPASQTYREWVEQATHDRNWVVGAAVLTIFVEGSVKDRTEISQRSSPKTQEEIERLVNAHPLVQYHGLFPKAMDLIRAHQMVEAGHRHAAYEMVLGHAVSADQQTRVIDALHQSLTHWLHYRDGIAEACGLGPG
jgi:pyrroloquinoline-quinone synthase